MSSASGGIAASARHFTAHAAADRIGNDELLEREANDHADVVEPAALAAERAHLDGVAQRERTHAGHMPTAAATPALPHRGRGGGAYNCLLGHRNCDESELGDGQAGCSPPNFKFTAAARGQGRFYPPLPPEQHEQHLGLPIARDATHSRE